jgi:hypothetical protein
MKKELKAILIIGPILIATAIGLAFVLPLFKPDSTNSLGVVRIYVNSTLSGSITNEIGQYKQDVINQGYSVNVVNWSDTNVSALRNDLINASQQPEGLKGAVLVGKFPSVMMQYYDNLWSINRTYPIDLFLTDLDGEWIDLDHADGLPRAFK